MKKYLTGICAILASCVLAEDSAATSEAESLKPEIISAESWGSEPDPIPEDRSQVPKYITIHHAGEEWKEDADPYRKLRGLQSWGKRERDWPDLPYHFLLSPDGRIFEGRSTDFKPETNTNYELEGHVGINCWGNFEIQRVTKDQLTSVVRLAAWLSEKHNIDPQTITSHKDVAPGQTVCPGTDLYRYVETGMIADWVIMIRSGKDPQITLLPPLEEGPQEFAPPGLEGTPPEKAADEKN